jgi:4-amino-4-deoxy-L-arabinose transferase-like glycosyltransferase
VRGRSPAEPPAWRDGWLIAILVVAAVLDLWHLRWGLPAGEHSWAVDAIDPPTALAIVAHSVRPWNSGYFYFKYPPAYPFLLCAAFAPYLAYLAATHQWVGPKASFPYGFAHPEHALTVLALIARGLNVAFALGTVALAYAIARRLWGRWAARVAAWLVATTYPLVFYAHTSNVDASYAFWLLLALLAAIRASESDAARRWVLLGVAAGLAMATKEQAFGFLLPLPFLAVLARFRAHRTLAVLWSRPVVAMAIAAAVTAVIANNALLNPFGVIARLAYLTGHPITHVSAPLKPVAFAWFKPDLERTYLAQLWDGLDSAFGASLAVLALFGLLASVWSSRGRAWVLLPACGYYYLSLRGQQLITLRYMIPLVLVLGIAAGALLVQIVSAMPRGGGRVAMIAAAAVLALANLGRSAELDWLLTTDARYRAEDWLATRWSAGGRGEVYQKSVYLPRFRPPLQVEEVPIAERTIDGLTRRSPDFIVVSSVSEDTISHVWSPDWRETGGLLQPVDAAVAFDRALKADQLGYVVGHRFRQQTRLLRPRITNVAPEIAVYVRADAAAAVPPPGTAAAAHAPAASGAAAPGALFAVIAAAGVIAILACFAVLRRPLRNFVVASALVVAIAAPLAWMTARQPPAAIVLAGGLALFAFGILIVRVMLTRSVSLHLLATYASAERTARMSEQIAERIREAQRLRLVSAADARLALTPIGRIVATLIGVLYRVSRQPT